MGGGWDKFSYSSSSTNAVLDPDEAQATDEGDLEWQENPDVGGTTANVPPRDASQFAGSEWDQEDIGGGTEPAVPGSPERRARARPQSAVEYPAPTKSDTGSCDGEIIEVLDSRVVCWLTISDKLRVRSALDESLFDNLPKYPGAVFCWSPDSGAVSPLEFDNDDLIAECDRLEREWDEDLKHRTPRMAD